MAKNAEENRKKIQEAAFTNWVNASLGGRAAKTRVQNLQTDLQDGTVLAELLESISAKSIGPYNKNPSNKAIGVENLGTCFRFLEREKVKVISIGPGDVSGGNLKLILSLIWTLIRHYQIRSTGKDAPTKTSMLAWIGTQIPAHNIRNFTTDWNNGLALCALVEHIKPGSCLQYSTLEPRNGLANCELGIRLAEKHFGIPKILDAAALNNPDVDELGVMTYVSYFCKPANENLMRWLKGFIPDRNITNLTTDWNSGINLARLLDVIKPGCFPNWNQLNPASAIQNIGKAMDVAKAHLQVDLFIKVTQMADPAVEELNQAIVLFRLQAAYKPIPKTIACSGPGLTKAVKGCSASFQVDGGTLEGEPVMSALIVDQKKFVPVSVMKLRSGVFQGTYTPPGVGKLSLDIKWEGGTDNHYNVEVVDPGSVAVSSKYFEPGQLAKVNKLVTMEVKGLKSMEELSVTIQHQNGATEKGKVVSTGANTAEVTYTPQQIDIDEIIVQLMGATLPGSPFKVPVVDPTKYSMHIAVKSLVVTKEMMIAIDGDPQGLKASAMSPSGTQELSVVAQSKETSVVKYTPTEVGQHTIHITCDGEHIKGSPLDLCACNPSKCILIDPLPRYLQVGASALIRVGTKEAGPGQLDCVSSSTSVATATVTKDGRDYHMLKITAVAVGESLIHLTWTESEIPRTPFTICVCDTSQCSIFGQGLSSGVGKTGVPFEFTVNTAQAGPGELTVKVQGPTAACSAIITKVGEVIYEVSFTASEIGQHSIDVKWAGVSILNSPFWIKVIEGVDSKQFTLKADTMTSIALQPMKCVLVGPVGDLVKNGLLQVKLRGQGFESKIVGPSAFKPVATAAQITVTEIKKGAYEIQYYAPRPGQFILSVTIDEVHVPGSPFHVKSLPTSDASGCLSYGSALENRSACVLGKPIEFNLDLTKAGTGTLGARAVNCKCKIVITKQQPKVYLVTLEPKEGGTHTIELMWGSSHIPGSPFIFNVADPSSIAISDLPGKEYVALVGVPFVFSINIGSVDASLLKVDVRLSNGSLEPCVVSKLPDGMLKVSYTPTSAGEIEFLVSCAQLSLLKSPLKYTVLNLSQIQLVPPPRYCRTKDSVKFGVSGVNLGDPKLSITATHSELGVAAKVTFDPTGGAQFTPRSPGEHVISVMYANHHVSGSPFSVFTSDPEACVITSPPPTVVHVGEMAAIIVDTSNAGVGELSCSPTSLPNDLPLSYKVVKNKQDFVLFSCGAIGASNMVVMWAGHPIPSPYPLVVNFVDASKAKWTCGHSMDCGVVMLGESVPFAIDCSESGQGKPDIQACSPNGHTGVQVEVDEGTGGHYKATFKPLALGMHEVTISLAGKPVGAQARFEVIQNVPHSAVTLLTGEALNSVVAGKPSKVIVHASEPGLGRRGLLQVNCTSDTMGQDDPRLPKLRIDDSYDGTYVVHIQASEPGLYLLHVYCLKQPISGSPFALSVKQSPDASKCVLRGQFAGAGAALVNAPVELAVDTTDAGWGQLTAVITDPYQRAVRSSIVEERGQQTLQHLKFVPQTVGNYRVSIAWDGAAIPQSPVTIRAINPFECAVRGFPAHALPIGRLLNFTVDTSSAGDAVPVVMVSDLSNPNPTTMTAAVNAPHLFTYPYKAAAVGVASFDITYNGTAVSGSPFKVAVVDPSACNVSVKDFTAGKVFLINREITLSIAANVQELSVTVEVQGETQQLTVVPQGGGLCVCIYKPTETGVHTVCVTCGGENVKGSPLQLMVTDPSKCVLNMVPRYLHLGPPAVFTVSTRDAGPGQLECLSSNTSVAIAAVAQHGQDLYTLTLTPVSIGEATVQLTWARDEVPPGPFTVYVCDATQCSAYGQGLTSGVGKTGEPFDFVMKTAQTGPGKPSVMVQGPKAVSAAKVLKTADGMYSVIFTTSEVGLHMIDVRWTDFPIPNSPFKVDFIKRIDTTPFVVTGNGVGVCRALKLAQCSLMGPVSDLMKKGLLQVKLSGEGFESKTVEPSELKPVTTDALVSILEGKKGAYDIQYCTPKAGLFSLSILVDERAVPGSPFQIQSLPYPDTTHCSVYGSAFEDHETHVLGKPIEFKVDLAGVGTGVLTAKPVSGNCKVLVTEEEDRVYSVKVEPKRGGLVKMEVLWDDVPIVGSPFSFDVVDTSSITVTGLPNPKDHVVKVGELFAFSVSLGTLDRTPLKAEAVHSSGKIEAFVISADPSTNVVTLSYTPNTVGEFQLLLTYAKFSLLKSALKYPIVDSALFQITLQSKYYRVKETVRFSISGLQQGDQRLTITAVHKVHDAAVKLSYDRGTAVAQFTPKQLGEYVVSGLYATCHIRGSPFSIRVVDPDACIITSPPPPVAHIKDLVTLIVDKSKAGPGELGCSSNNPAVQVRIIKNRYDCCVFSSDTIGTGNLVATWAGYPIPSPYPLVVNFVDASKAKWTCGHSMDCGVVMLGESVPFAIDCSESGQGKPEVEVVGPSGSVMVQVDEDKRVGYYTAALKPSKLGRHTTTISLGGKKIGSPVEFEVIKNASISSISLVGSTVIFANRPAELMLHASEPQLVNKRLLTVECTSDTVPKGDPRLPKLTIQDNNDGTYMLRILAAEQGEYLLSVCWFKRPIPGSPFALVVRPSADASKCIIMGRFAEVTTTLVATPVEVTVDTTDAGYGAFDAVVTDPYYRTLKVASAEEKGERTLHRVKFVPNVIGLHTVSMTWNKVAIPGSPLRINAIDPYRCIVSQFPTNGIQLGQALRFIVDTQLAGNAPLVVTVREGNSGNMTALKAINQHQSSIYEYNYKATKAGTISFDILFGEHHLSGTPFNVVVVDPLQHSMGPHSLGKSPGVHVSVPNS